MTQSQPILMSGAMVRAILEGRKSQTRRIIKPQPPAESVSVSETLMSRDNPAEEGAWEWWAGRPQQVIYGPIHLRYRRGQLLWVRETWVHYHTVNHIRRSHGGAFSEVSDGLAGYRADGHDSIDDFKDHIRLMSGADFEGIEVRGDCWRPSIHMPRWASRLTLEVTGVKVERLQDLSEEDAKAEGATPVLVPPDGGSAPHVEGFRDLWASINGPGSWEANPFVVAVSFIPHPVNIDQLETRKDAQR